MDLHDALAMAAVSDAGRVRSHNEDSTAFDPRVGMALLADGMGGYHGGEVASAIAVTHVFTDVREGLAGLVPGETNADTGLTYESLLVRDAFLKANSLVYAASRADADAAGMGTTLVALLFYDNRVTVAHVGDSRAYRFRDGGLQQMTTDHSVVQEMVDGGFYTHKEARQVANPHLLTRAIGVSEAVAPGLREYDVVPGDRFLLCSDGLTDMLPDTVLAATLSRAGDDPGECARRLVDQANHAGGLDNVSVVLVQVLRAFPVPRDTWYSRMVGWFNETGPRRGRKI